MDVRKIVLERPNGFCLASWYFHPKGESKATVVLLHGLGEHAGRYRHWASFFTKAQLGLLVFDQRGHGLSDGKRGHAALAPMQHDAAEAVGVAQSLVPEKPVFLYGHSFGGNVALGAVLSQPALVQNLQGLILTSPWLALAFEPPAPLLALGRLMAKLYPAFTQANRLDPSWLSRDPAVAQAYVNDPLVHNKISAGLFAETSAAAKQAHSQAEELKISTLLMHGTEDCITSFQASRQFSQKAGPNVVFKAWPGLRHELHQEPEKRKVAEYIIAWIGARLR